MPTTAKAFTAKVPHHAEDANTGQIYLVDDIVVQAIAYINADGSLKDVDMELLLWKGNNVTQYIYECQPGTWDRIKDAVWVFYLTTNCHVTS
jgi:hypothetical protein